jgi:hypothetical protein
MEMVRGFVGFVLGAVVVVGLHFAGLLDAPTHWWARNVTHRGDNAYEADPEHARYAISAIFRAANNGEAGCEPRYEFINRTMRTVKFLPDGIDDSIPGNPNRYTAQTSGSGYVSTTPDQPAYGPPSGSESQQGYDPQDYGPSNDDQQSYGQSNASYGEGDDSGDSYGDDAYPGAYGQAGSCNPGTVQIILDRRQ